MGLLKRKEEKTETIAVRVPSSLKAQLEELRDRADAAGFDLTATMRNQSPDWRSKYARNWTPQAPSNTRPTGQGE